MLILSRRCQETIVIGDDVNITVLSVIGNQVRIGIDAPKEVPVHREEIYYQIPGKVREEQTEWDEEERIQQEQEAALLRKQFGVRSKPVAEEIKNPPLEESPEHPAVESPEQPVERTHKPAITYRRRRIIR